MISAPKRIIISLDTDLLSKEELHNVCNPHVKWNCGPVTSFIYHSSRCDNSFNGTEYMEWSFLDESALWDRLIFGGRGSGI